jgi:tetratricopeptide (TPR) repeat protein
LHDAAWPRLDAAITDWVSAWDETRAQVCGDDEPDVAATRCLTWALADVRAIVDVLGRGDATALSRELDRAVSRPSPSRCREAAVVATTPPLAPEAIDDQVEEIRTRLRQAQRQREQGEYAVALAVAEAAMADASALDFPPLHMECGLAVGEAMAATGPYERAREVLEQTYAQADSAGYTVVAARAASQLAELLGTELRDAEGATPWTTRALAAARAAGDPALLSEAEGRVASTAVAAGKSAEARVLYEGLRARLTRECPAPCAQLVKVELELSWLLEEQGEHDAALQHAHAGLALAREVGGDGHLHTGAAHNRLCALLMRGGEYEAAKEQCTQGWTITRAVFGDEHTDTASSLAMLATVELTMGDAEAARPRLERAHAVFERILGPQHRQTQAAASNLALMAMYAGDYAAASRGFEAVLAAIEADPSASPAERITIHNALAEVRIKTGDFASAVHHLEQAIALGKAANHSGEALSRLRTRLGVALVELGRFAEAELVLGDAIAAESGVNAVYNGALRRCTLARAIADTDRPRALRLLDEALRQLGDEDPELAAQCRAQRERLRP